MKRRDFIKTMGLGVAATAWRWVAGSAVTGALPAKTRPNIFIYIADDQYRDSVGCYGAKPSHTPNIDRLAKEGLRFTHAFTPSAICTPNRGCLLSGLYPLRNGAHPNHSGFKDGVKSLPNYMKELNYRAALVGKDGIQRPSDLYEWETKIEKTDQRVPGADEPTDDRHRKSDLAAIERFISVKSARPFCLFHAASLPHQPYLNEIDNGLSGYDASNWYMDYEFGEVLKLLRQNGLEDTTLVLYVNDNEAGRPRTKNTLYETGTRVAMVARWPGHVKPGATTDAVVGFIDILPTLIEIAGGVPPSDLDGKTIVDVLEGRTNHHHDELFFSYTGVTVGSKRQEIPYPIRSIRTERYRYIRNLNHTIGHPKLLSDDDGGMRAYEELYDIIADPGETKNLAELADFQQVRRKLSAKVDAWMKRTGDRGIESELQALIDFAAKK